MNVDPQIIWGIALLVTALVLLLLEIFVPSAGLIGLAALACLISGLFCLFRVDTTLGLVSSLVTVLAIPLVVGYGLKVAPDTFIIRLLTLKSNQKRFTDPQTHRLEDEMDVAHLINQTGTASTDLRPVGSCQIQGKRYDCLATTGMIRSGTPIQVTAIDGMTIQVAPQIKT